MKKSHENQNQTGHKAWIGAIMIYMLSVMLLSCSNKSDNTPAPPPPPPPQSTAARVHDTVYQSVDVMPEFPGGNQAMITYIANNIKYPEAARNNKTEGKVLISFVVGTDGSVDDVKVVQGVDPEIDSEALRVVRSLPKFDKPAIKNGKEVAVSYMVPINFKLDGKK